MKYILIERVQCEGCRTKYREGAPPIRGRSRTRIHTNQVLSGWK